MVYLDDGKLGSVKVPQSWLFVTPWTVALQAPLSLDSPGKHTGIGCHFLLQGIFLTQGSSPGLQHYRQILHHLSHQGSPLECCSALKKKWAVTLERHGRNLNADDWVTEVCLQKVTHSDPNHMTSWKRQNSEDSKEVNGGQGLGAGKQVHKHRGFLGQWNHSIWYNGSRASPQSVQHQTEPWCKNYGLWGIMMSM